MAGIDSEIQEWYASHWWADDEYARAYRDRISVDAVNELFAAVADVFSPRWAASVGSHPAFPWIGARGLDPLSFVIGLGRDLLRIKGAAGYRKIIEDLRSPTAFDSARFELAVGVSFVSAGYEVEFRAPLANGKESDIRATKNAESTYIEIKAMQVSMAEAAMNYFNDGLFFELNRLVETVGSPVHESRFHVALDAGLTSMFGIGNTDPHLIRGLLHLTLQEVTRTISTGAREFDVAHVGHFSFFAASERQPGISWFPLSPAAELKRMLQSHLVSAIDQLPNASPGFIMIRTYGGLDQELTTLIVRSLLLGLDDMASHVSAVVFLPVLYSMPKPWASFKAFAVLNPSARFAALGSFDVIDRDYLESWYDTPAT